MSNTPINQHYIPQFYLKGFIEPSNKKRQILVYDIKNSKTFYSNIKNISSERYFNRIELQGIPSDELEKKLSELAEAPCSRSIRQVEDTRKFEGEDRKNILNLIALMAVRNPFIREHYDSIEEQLARVVLSATVNVNEGTIVNGTLIITEHKEFINSEEYDIKFSRDWQIKRELDLLPGVINLLNKRKWTLIYAPKDLFFITCDRPVSLYSKLPDNRVHFSGFDLIDRQLIFPLSKNLVLIGDFKEDENTFTAPKQTVVAINSNILMAASAQVYAPNSEFYIKNHEEEIIFSSSVNNSFKNR